MGELKINTLFRWCNDIRPMRIFYTDLLGLPETFFRDDKEHGWLTYNAGGVQLVFMRASEELSVGIGWALQPGYRGGTQEVPSWLMTATDRNEFRGIVNRLQQAAVPMKDNIDSSRQCIVHDPMGWTIEIGLDVEASG